MRAFAIPLALVATFVIVLVIVQVVGLLREAWRRRRVATNRAEAESGERETDT